MPGYKGTHGLEPLSLLHQDYPQLASGLSHALESSLDVHTAVFVSGKLVLALLILLSQILRALNRMSGVGWEGHPKPSTHIW